MNAATTENEKPSVFISHVSEEGELALIIKQHLLDNFPGSMEAFASSDIRDIGAGEQWLPSLEGALRRARLLLVLCSHASLRRPWVNFEVGATWLKGIGIVPICHSGLDLASLPIPFSLFHGIQASEEKGIVGLNESVAKAVGGKTPGGDLGSTIARISAFETRYGASIARELGPVTARATASRKRVYDALRDPEFKWRSVSKLAVLSGLTEDEVLELLLSDENVLFGRGVRTNQRIARLKDRSLRP